MITRLVGFGAVDCDGDKYFATIASTADNDLRDSKIEQKYTIDLSQFSRRWLPISADASGDKIELEDELDVADWVWLGRCTVVVVEDDFSRVEGVDSKDLV